MVNERFAVLTGNLNEYPLSDLVGVLRHQRKTGRLLIEYANGPATFYFSDGELVDAQLGELAGLQAICVAVGQPPAAFNFNPLIRPSRTSIENSLQRVVSELVGCWDESFTQIDTVITDAADGRSLIPTAQASEAIMLEEVKPLSLPGLVAQETSVNYSRLKLTLIAMGLILIGLSTGIAVTHEFSKTAVVASTSSLLVKSAAGRASESVGVKNLEARVSSKTEGASGRGNSRDLTTEPAGRKSAEARRPDRNTEPKAVVDGRKDAGQTDNQSDDNGSDGKSIKVVMQIENGRVLKASVAKSQAGMESYEATALRIARQRRYPAQRDGQGTITIRVTQP